MTSDTRSTLAIVTGLSGAGKSQALHALEDLGFFCIDNLPPPLANEAVSLCERGGMRRIALGIDARVRAFLDAARSVLSTLEEEQRDLHVLFLDASDAALLRRFNETRRPHPLIVGGEHVVDGAAVLDGLKLERERLAPLRARATRVIDTTNVSVHDLRRMLLAQFGPSSDGAPRMATRFVSFGFKYGPPVDADLVFDVRFLQNPYFVPELRSLSGLDAPIIDYVMSQDDTRVFLHSVEALLFDLLPKYEREGKSYLTVAVGCTGGRHRSVSIATELSARLGQRLDSPVHVEHRDIARGGERPSSEQRAWTSPPIETERPSQRGAHDEK